MWPAVLRWRTMPGCLAEVVAVARGFSVSSGVPAQHRPFSRLDVEACRRVLTGNHVSPTNNPGIRLESRFLPEVAVQPLLSELRAVGAECGFPTAGHGLSLLSRGGTESDAGSVETRRVTGRPEGQGTPAPWGYGDAFAPDAVPPELAGLVRRIRECGAFSLGRMPPQIYNPTTSFYFHVHMFEQCYKGAIITAG